MHEHFTMQINCKWFFDVSFLIMSYNRMLHSRALEHRINRINERNLRFIYPNQQELTFKEPLEKNKTVSIHQRNLETLAT